EIQKAESRKQKATSGFRFRSPTAYCLLPTAYCLLPTAYFLLPTAYSLLPTAYCLPPTAYCLLPTSYCLPQYPPTTNNFILAIEHCGLSGSNRALRFVKLNPRPVVGKWRDRGRRCRMTITH